MTESGPLRHRTAVAAVIVAYSVAQPVATPQDGSLQLSDVAGKYWMSDGRDRRWSLTVRKDGRFTSTRFVGDSRSDARQPRDGVASVSGGHLYLVVPPGDEAYVFLPVRLGGRLYLVPPGNTLDFCIALSKGTEPRRSDIGDVLLRQGDERITVPKGMTPSFCKPPGSMNDRAAEQSVEADKAPSRRQKARKVAPRAPSRTGRFAA
jgi:hypothetical protein